MTPTRYLEFAGHRLAYRVAGEGPALVVLQLYRRREDVVQLRSLSHRWKVCEIAPLGYGRSDRVPGYAGERLADQVLAVLDEHGVDRFIVWGYSKGGAMAACIARATPRAAGLICGGYSLFDRMTDGTMRQLDRRLHPNHPSRSLWPWVRQFDWAEELRAMSCPRLLYWGSEDRQMAKRLRRSRERLDAQGTDFLEFPGLDHGAFTDQVVGEVVIPAAVDWVERRVGSVW
jgi:pimeloyl-ACP methyl ester carboxylesterase